MLFFKQINTQDIYKFIESDLLILGDSHASMALDPSLFVNKGLRTTSYSKAGHYAEFNYYLYQKYRDKYPAPSIVIISTPYFVFSNSEKDKIYFLFDQNKFLTYYFSNNILSITNFFDFRELFLRLPLQTYYESVNKKDVNYNYGYATNINPTFITENLITKNYMTDLHQKKIEYKDKYSKDIAKNKKNYFYLDELLAMLVRDNVRVCLIETPEYIDIENIILGKEKFYQEMQTLVKKYSNVTFLQESDITSIDPYDKSLFFDAGYNSHLSFEGSQLYTQEIIDLCK